MSNYISASLSSDDQKKALSLIAELRGILSFGIKLNADQKASMAKIDDARLPFVEKSLQHGSREPLIVPPFTSLDELSRDLELFKALNQLEKELLSLTETVVDTRVGAGCDAYQAALSIYNSAKGASKMGIPGTQTIVDDLKKLFETQGNKTTKTSSTAS